MAAPLRVATRGSRLARLQAEQIAQRIDGDVELVIVRTTGDRRTDVPIHSIGGRGVFVKEVEAAVLEGRADLAVHSAKDLPSTTAPGLELVALPARGDPRDALVGAPLAELPTGGRIGTGAVRRRAQLAGLRPDLTFGDLRGNIETRLEKASSFAAVVVAAAALDRLGLGDRVAQRLDTDVMLPQVGQGALAVECRAEDTATRRRVVGMDDPAIRDAVTAERAFLAELGGGCDLPCGGLATATAAGLDLTGVLASLDGHVVLRARAAGGDPAALGRRVARTILDDQGGTRLLEDTFPAVTW